MRKLPVFRSVGEVFAGVTRHFFELLRIALVPVALSFGVFAAAAFWVDDPELVRWTLSIELPEETGLDETDALAEEDKRSRAIMFGLAVLASYLIYVPAIVSWHRFVLYGEKTSSLLRWEDMRYVISVIKIALAFLFFLIPMGIAVAGIVWLAQKIPGLEEGALLSPAGISAAAAIAAGYVIATGLLMRMSLALPDASIGGKGGIEDMIDRTRGNTWRLVGFNTLILLAMLPISVLYGFAAEFVMGLEIGGLSPTLLAALINMPLTLYLSMLSITMLSVAYREIVGLPGFGEPQASPAIELPAGA
ncbi:MAG: hypothetical protein KF895_10615 [Parvibaculum sp.]|nr:hypothetical protein [Parvibaculum sp.]